MQRLKDPSDDHHNPPPVPGSSLRRPHLRPRIHFDRTFRFHKRLAVLRRPSGADDPWGSVGVRPSGGLRACPDTIRPTHARTRQKHWQFADNSADEIVVYSAFYDDRPVLETSTWIRILGVAAINSSKPAVFCQVWFDGCPSPFITVASLNRTGRRIGYKFHNRTYIQYLVSCRVPGVEPVPTHVSLAFSRCARSTIYLPVQRPLRSPHDHEFGVCVAISFNHVPIPIFVEWMEFNRILGITEFNIYDANMVNMSGVFDYYTKLGVLRVFPTPPAVDSMSYDAIKLSSPASLNDCMMRNMYRYRYVVAIDFDEVIVPKMHRNYPEMLTYIDRTTNHKEPYLTYSFRNTLFFLDFRPDASQPAHLRTAAHRTRIEYSRPGYAPKSFVDPRRCLSIFNHFCFMWIKKPAKQCLIDVDPRIAASQHYRACEFNRTRCDDLMRSRTQDDTALRFKGELGQAVEDVLRHLNQFTQQFIRWLYKSRVVLFNSFVFFPSFLFLLFSLSKLFSQRGADFLALCFMPKMKLCRYRSNTRWDTCNEF